MIQLQADEGVPIPPRCRGEFRPGRRNIKYLWHLLDAKGKSLFFVGLTQAAVSSGAKAYWKRRVDDAKFETRAWEEDGVKGVRVWRVS